MRRINVKLLFCSLACFVLLCAGIVLAHYFQSERIARALLRQADRAENEGHLGEACRFLGRYLEFVPEDTDQRARLGGLLASDRMIQFGGSNQRALFVLEQVLARDPDRQASRLLLVKLALDLQRNELVAGHLKVLQEALPDDGEVERLTGRWYEARGEYEEAADWYRQAVRHDHKQIDTYMRLANLLRKRSETPNEQSPSRADSSPPKGEGSALRAEADRLMDEMVSQNEGAYQAHLARWQYRREWEFRNTDLKSLAQSKKLEEAGRDVTRALELAAQEGDVLLAAAEWDRLRREPASARNHLETGLKLHPQDARLHRALALLELETGRRDQAVAYLERGAHAVVEGDRFSLLWDLANIHIDGGNREEAAKVIDQVQGAQPTPGAVDYLRGRLKMAEGRWSAAARILEQVRPLLEVSPELIEQVDLQLGRCYERLNEPAAQLAAFGRVLARNRESLPARAGMAAAQIVLGRGDDALEQYRQLMNLPGAAPTGWIEIARLCIARNRQTAKGDWQEVESALRQAEKALPDAAEIPLLRAEALVAQHQPERARATLVNARERRPQQVEIWTALAALADQSGKHQESARILNEAEKQIGDQVELRLAWARWLTDHRDVKTSEIAEASQVSLEKLADDLDRFKAEDQARLLRGLASAQYRLGNTTQARELWTRLAKQPSSAHDLELRLVLFQLALQAKDRAAMKQLQSEMETIEGGPGPFGRLCEATRLIQEAKEGRRETLTQAQTLLELAAAQRPTWTTVILAKADIEDFKGDFEKAIFNYRRAIELGERNPRVLRRLVDLLCQLQRQDEADQEIRKLQNMGPLEGDLQRLAVAFSLQKQDSARAVSLAMQTVQESSADYRDHLWLGQVLSAAASSQSKSVQSSAEEAEKQFRRAVELAPQVPDTWLALVRYLAGAQKPSEAEKVIDQARDHLPKDGHELTLAACFEAIGRLDRADEQYRNTLDAKPRDPVVLRNVAAFYLRAGRAEDAESILKRLMETKSEGRNAKSENSAHANWGRRQLAYVLIDRGEHRQALVMVGLDFDKTGNIVEKEPARGEDAVEELRARARILARFGSRAGRDRAIAYLEDMTNKHALSPDDQLLLAKLYEMNGSWEKARSAIRTLAPSFSRNPSYLAYYIRGLLLHDELNDAERFIDELEQQEKSRKTPPGAFGSTELKAQLLEARGESQKALTLLEAQARAPDASPEAIMMLISALARQRRWSEALELADRVWERVPAETVGGISVALLRDSHSNEDARAKVERRIRAAIQADPKSANIALQLADLLEISDRFDEAESLYRQIVAQHDRNMVALNNLSWILALKPRKAEEALGYINQAIEIAGPMAHLLDTRAVVYLALEQSGSAIADLENALADSPSAFRYFHLARAHRMAGHLEAAAEAFRKAAESGLEPDQLHPAERLAFREMRREYDSKRE
jgi:tetratricopeptide (TPR) repeat protein